MSNRDYKPTLLPDDFGYSIEWLQVAWDEAVKREIEADRRDAREIGREAVEAELGDLLGKAKG